MAPRKRTAKELERSKKLKEKRPAERATCVYLALNREEKANFLKWIGAARWTYNEALEKMKQRRKELREHQEKKPKRPGRGKRRCVQSTKDESSVGPIPLPRYPDPDPDI